MKAVVRMVAPAAVLAPIRKRAVAAGTDAAEFLLEEANRTVPIEEAVLEGSGHVTTDADALVFSVSYDTPYAVRQHEDTRLRHDSGRRAKWLEYTFREQRLRVLTFLADRMRRAV